MAPGYVVLGAGIACATALALGKLLFAALRLRFYRVEEEALAFLSGSAVLSLITLGLGLAGLARKGVFIGLAAAAIGAAARTGRWRPGAKRLPAMPWMWRLLLLAAGGTFFTLYAVNAMAPEISPDGAAYHLGTVARYAREHRIPNITTNMYANLWQGAEMLFLFAFAVGRHSAASLVHFAFLVALAIAVLSYGRRIGNPAAGAFAALLVFASPAAGIDGVSAYNDVAAAAAVFGVFYLLEIWDAERTPRVLICAGLLAGFAAAVKYTAGIAVVYAAGYVLWRSRRLRPVLVVSACALISIAPWAARNWVRLGNPVSPFFNRLFPNPYIHIWFEQDYTPYFRNYEMKSRGEILLDVLVNGKISGPLGPAFFIAPFALLALRRREGRRLLLAGVLFGAPWVLNVASRFLLPALPFLALAMALVLTRVPAVAVLAALAHSLFSWPASVETYAPQAWRIAGWPWRAALRIQPEDEYLSARIDKYPAMRMVERLTPPGASVFSFSGVPDAYCAREILTGYQAAGNQVLHETLWTPFYDPFKPTWRHQFRFPPARLRRLRIEQSAAGAKGLWSVGEVHLFLAGREIPRAPSWRIDSRPNPWEAGLALDGNPSTRWRTWEAVRPGMFLEIDFGGEQTLDTVAVDGPHDQPSIRLRLLADGRPLGADPELLDVPEPPDMRRAAALELKRRGIGYLLLFTGDFGAVDYHYNARDWGWSLIGSVNDARLYRID